MIESILIRDPLEAHTERAIEVHVKLNSGAERWCYFLSPEGITNCGDLIDNTQTRVHYGANHMFVVSTISEENIKKALKMVENNGELERCTLPIE